MLFVLELYWGKDKKRKEKERKGKKRKEKKRKRKEKKKERKEKERKEKKRKGKKRKEKGKKRKEKERNEKERKGKKRKGKKRKEKERKEKERKGKKRKEKNWSPAKAWESKWWLMESNYEKEMNKRNEKIPYEKEMNKRNEKIPDPQNCLGGQLLISTLKLFWEGGGEGGGDPYTNQHPTLQYIVIYLLLSADWWYTNDISVVVERKLDVESSA